MSRTICHQEFFACKLVADKVGGMPENKGVRVGDTIYLNPTMLAMIQVAAAHELPKLLDGFTVLDFTECYQQWDKPLPMVMPPPRPITERDYLNRMMGL